MTARTAKNARLILDELAQVESQIARLQAETTREISKLSVRREELRIALVAAYGDPAGPSGPLSAPPAAPTLGPVAGHKSGRNLMLEAVGNLREWCKEPGRPSYSAAKSWTSAGASTQRPIPKRWAEFFRDNHGIPMDWWPHGITEGYPDQPRRRVASRTRARAGQM